MHWVQPCALSHADLPDANADVSAGQHTSVPSPSTRLLHSNPSPPPPLQDKSDPKAWDKPEDMTVIPSEAELQRTALDDIKTFFGLDGSSAPAQ